MNRDRTAYLGNRYVKDIFGILIETACALLLESAAQPQEALQKDLDAVVEMLTRLLRPEDEGIGSREPYSLKAELYRLTDIISRAKGPYSLEELTRRLTNIEKLYMR